MAEKAYKPPKMFCFVCQEEDHTEKMCPWQMCRKCGARGHGRRDCPFEGRVDSHRIERNMVEVERELLTIKESLKTLGDFADQFGDDTDRAILNLKSKVNKLILPLMGEVYEAIGGELERRSGYIRRANPGMGGANTRTPLEMMGTQGDRTDHGRKHRGNDR